MNHAILQWCYDTSKDNIVNLEIEISEKEIYDEFKSINIFKSFGPDSCYMPWMTIMILLNV